MGIAKLYGQKASGININGIIKDYYAYAGENISAGDLVEYINGVAGQTTETSANTQLSNVSHTADVVSAVKLDDSRVFIAHSYTTDYYLYGIVVTINGTTITAGTDTQLSTTTYTARAISTQLLPNGNVFIAHDYGYSNRYLYGMIVSINGTTITTGVDNKLNANMTYTGYAISTQLLSNGNIFIAHSYSKNDLTLYGMIVSINGTTITAGTDIQLNNTDNSGVEISTQLLPNGNIFIAHSYDLNHYLYGMVVTINGTNITHGTDTQLSAITNAGVEISTQLLPNGNVFIAHSYNSSYHYLYAMVVTINETTITTGTDTQLNSTGFSGRAISTQLLSNGNIFIAHSYTTDYYLYAMVVTINETTITTGTDTQLNDVTYSGYFISTELLLDGNVFIVHSYNADSYLYAQICGVDENNVPTNQIKVPTYEQQVRKATTPQFDGVAKTSGIGGDETGHEDLVSIYTL